VARQGVEVAGQARLGILVVFRPGDEGDAAVALLDQVRAGVAGALVVVQA